MTLNVYHGLHEDGAFAEGGSVWFVAETVGDNEQGRVANHNHQRYVDFIGRGRRRIEFRKIGERGD